MRIMPALAVTLIALSANAEPEPIVIGWTGPLTGNSAVVGVDSIAAVRLVVDEANRSGGINGRPLKLVVEDDGYVTARAVSAYRKLVDIDGAVAIIANTYGGVFATAGDAVRDGVLVIDPLDCNEEIAALPENTLCLATKTESISAAFSKHIIEAGVRTALLLVEESDGWMQLIAEDTRKVLEQSGVRVLVETSPPTTSTYRASILKGKRAGAAAVVILGNDQMGIAPREMRELGYGAQIYGIGSILSPGFQLLAGNSTDGALVSSWLAERGPDYDRFAAAFKAETGRLPALELAALPSYDAATLLVGCLRDAATTNTNAEAVRACMLGRREFRGLTGMIAFDQDGAVRSIHERLFRLSRGQLKPLEDQR